MSRLNKYSRPKRKVKKRYIALALILVLVASAGIYLAYINKTITATMDDIYEELDRGEKSDKRDEPIGDTDPISIALLGIDAEQGDSGRTDTIVIITLNPEEESMYMFNIPRDTRTEIVGRGIQDKINHAHAFGGTDMAIDTIENFLDIPIDYYAKVNLEGFVSIIDIFGGVTVDVEFPFTEKRHQFTAGTMHMDGEKALAYARMRKQDPRGDFGRNDRQQQVIQALISEASSVRTITRIDDILEELVVYSRSNVQRQQMNNLLKNYLGATKNQETLKLEGKGQSINGIYYYVVEDQERQRVSGLLKSHLDLNSTISEGSYAAEEQENDNNM